MENEQAGGGKEEPSPLEGEGEVPSVKGQVRFGHTSEAGPAADREGQAANLVKVLLDNAVRLGATAVHLDLGKSAARVHYRIKENLVPRPDIPGGFRKGLAAGVKTLARMNPLETRAPQEGRIRAKVSGREVDVFVSTMPARAGEKIVIRFTDGATDVNS